MKILLFSNLCVAMLIAFFAAGCSGSLFVSNGAAGLKSQEISFGGDETRSMTDVIISVDQSQSMVDVQAALADGIRNMTVALHGYPITYHIITPTAFEQPHLQGNNTWLHDKIIYTDANGKNLFQIWDNKFAPDRYTNPFSTIDAASIRYFDENGNRVDSVVNQSRPYRITYGTKTLGPTAKYAILQTDSYEKALALSGQIAQSVQLGAGGDSSELSMCSMLKYVRDRIMDPNSPEYRENPLLALINVSDENSNDHLTSYNSFASKCFETSQVEHFWGDSSKWAPVEACENEPANCVDPTPMTVYWYRYFTPTITVKCERLVDNTLVDDTFSKRGLNYCNRGGRNICDFSKDLPVPHSYTNALDIEAAGTQLGCTPGTTEWARLDKLEGGASGFSFPEHAEDRAISSFTDENNGRTYQNLADRAAQSNGMHVYEVYRRDSPRVRVKLDRIKKNHTFSYHNQEMKDVIESTDANVRATFPDVIGRSLVEMLEEKTLGYFYAGIVTTAEDQAERKDPNATVGTAQINLAAHIKENGSLKSNSAIHSVRSSDYASFMVPAMREFVDRFALSTYKLGLPAGQNVFSVGIKDQEGQVTAVEFTHDKAQASQFVAVLSDGSLQFNLPKLQELLGIQVAAGKQLTDEDLKDYTIVVQTIGE